jgi:DNA recombination protein RmuC
MTINFQFLLAALGALALITLCLMVALSIAKKNQRLLKVGQAALKKELQRHQHELGGQLRDIELKKQQSDTRLEDSKRQANGLWEQLKENTLKADKTLKIEREIQEAKLEKLRTEYNELQQQQTQLSTELKERDAGHARQVEQFELQKQALSHEFEGLANKIFEEKGKRFSETSQSTLDHLLQPFREQINAFQKRVNEVHDETLKGNAALDLEIKKLLDTGLKMSAEATNLTSALKGDSQQRGAWGEAQLERTLEMSGLVEEAHYEKQSSFKDQHGKQKYTDYIIKLPDNKHIIIDSKVSLVAYDKAISADSPEQERLALDEHAKSVKAKIDDLASKDYTNLIGIRSPSFVLMFIPVEPAYIEALKHNKDLFGYGYDKGIVLVSHTTLIPILRTVANLWMMERSNVEAREISDKAGDIYNQVCVVAENLQKLGVTLGAASNHYNKTVNALVGQRGLHGKVERFSTLSSKVSKTMPELDSKHIDFESDRLELIAEPVVESVIEPVVESEIKHQRHAKGEIKGSD